MSNIVDKLDDSEITEIDSPAGLSASNSHNDGGHVVGYNRKQLDVEPSMYLSTTDEVAHEFRQHISETLEQVKDRVEHGREIDEKDIEKLRYLLDHYNKKHYFPEDESASNEAMDEELTRKYQELRKEGLPIVTD